MPRPWSLLLAVVLIATSPAAAQQQTLTDAQIRDLLVTQSIAGYSGRCPCPYNTMSNGRPCGGNSAYSKPGGASPLCYPEDVTDDQARAFRSRSGSVR